MSAGKDAIEPEVVGGKFTVGVLYDMPDNKLFATKLQSDSMAPWELENGLLLTLWLPKEPTSTDLRAKPKGQPP